MDKNRGLLKFLKIEGIANSLTALIESKIELAKVEFKEELSVILSKMLISFILLIIGLFFLLFSSIALAFYIGSLFDKQFIGFSIVSSAYLLIFAILYFTRGGLKLHDYFVKMLRKTLHVK